MTIRALELIRNLQILNHPDVIKPLQPNLQNRNNIPMVTHQLHGTVRNKILNYKETTYSVFVDEEVSFRLDTDACVNVNILNFMI